jgi:hypothetical protein
MNLMVGYEAAKLYDEVSLQFASTPTQQLMQVFIRVIRYRNPLSATALAGVHPLNTLSAGRKNRIPLEIGFFDDIG